MMVMLIVMRVFRFEKEKKNKVIRTSYTVVGGDVCTVDLPSVRWKMRIEKGRKAEFWSLSFAHPVRTFSAVVARLPISSRISRWFVRVVE